MWRVQDTPWSTGSHGDSETGPGGSFPRTGQPEPCTSTKRVGLGWGAPGIRCQDHTPSICPRAGKTPHLSPLDLSREARGATRGGSRQSLCRAAVGRRASLHRATGPRGSQGGPFQEGLGDVAPGPAAVKVQVRPRQCRSGCLLCLESYCQESRSWWGGENRGWGGGSL